MVRLGTNVPRTLSHVAKIDVTVLSPRKQEVTTAPNNTNDFNGEAQELFHAAAIFKGESHSFAVIIVPRTTAGACPNQDER